MRCSRLSSTSSVGARPSHSDTAEPSGIDPLSRMPIVVAIGGHELLLIPDGGQFDDDVAPTRIGIALERLEGETCLAGAARSSQGQQPGAFQQPANVGEFALATYEGCPPRHQAGESTRFIPSCEPSEVRLRPGSVQK